VGGWMEKHFRRVSNILSGHIGKHTKIASTWCTCNTTTPLLCNRLALRSTSFQWGTDPYCRYWIQGYVNPLNSIWGRKALHSWWATQREKSLLNLTLHSGFKGCGIKYNTLPFSTPGSPLVFIHL
jgi:hypothetical protein